MLKHATGEEYSKENFQVFSPDGSESSYQPPIVKAEAPLQPVIYVLVSIMNSLFTYPPSVEYMVTETEKAYGDSLIPIIYICADTLQNITKNPLFGEKEGIIENTRGKWFNQYAKAVDTLKTAEHEPNHQVLYWDSLTAAPEYLHPKTFTHAILQPDPTLESLRKIYPTASNEVLENLIRDTQEAKISENVLSIANGFSSKNLSKLKKQAQKTEVREAPYRAATEQVIQQLKQLNVLPESTTNINEKSLKLQQKETELKLATYRYLAEEYAVFLLLAFLQNTSDIREKFHLAPDSFKTEVTTIQPLLSYPISTSQGGAELTFILFKTIEALYHKYCESLDLLPISQTLTLIDSVVPDQYHKRYMKIHPDSSKNNSAQFESGRSSPSSGTNSVVGIQPLPIAQNNLTTTKNYSNGTLSNLFSPPFDPDKITQKIIKLLDEHVETGEEKTTITYKNGVTCIVSVVDSIDKDYTSDSKADAQCLEKLTEHIKAAVLHAKTERWEETFIFAYKGYRFSFAVGPTPSLSQSLKPSSPTRR